MSPTSFSASSNRSLIASHSWQPDLQIPHLPQTWACRSPSAQQHKQSLASHLGNKLMPLIQHQSAIQQHRMAAMLANCLLLLSLGLGGWSRQLLSLQLRMWPCQVRMMTRALKLQQKLLSSVLMQLAKSTTIRLAATVAVASTTKRGTYLFRQEWHSSSTLTQLRPKCGKFQVLIRVYLPRWKALHPVLSLVLLVAILAV